MSEIINEYIKENLTSDEKCPECENEKREFDVEFIGTGNLTIEKVEFENKSYFERSYRGFNDGMDTSEMTPIIICSHCGIKIYPKKIN